MRLPETRCRHPQAGARSRQRPDLRPAPEIRVPNAGNLRPAAEIRAPSSGTPRTNGIKSEKYGKNEAEGYELGEVSYIFCSAQRLLEMNRQYLGHDYFTDVITFDYSDRKGARVISGDIFIDVETVADNARLYGFPTLQEMRRVVVHGVLHLCGQGDKTPRTNAQMHRKEDKYLKFWEES